MAEENMFASIADGILERAKANNPPEEGDYIGEDGLLYCGKCKTPRQYRLKWIDGNDRVVPSQCKCRKEEAERQKELERRRQQMERIERLKKNSLMDDKFRACTFDGIVETKENSRQLKICKRYAEKFDELYERNQGLLFYGDVGTGKTHFACCIGNYLMEHLRSVFATSLVKILQKAKSFKSEEDEEAYIRRMNEASLLILDDLGAERSTDYALEIVYNIIDSRYRSGKPMIVTTNLSLQEMKETTDIRYSRIYDRIFEICYPVEFKGKSWRMREAASRYDEMAKLLEEDT